MIASKHPEVTSRAMYSGAPCVVQKVAPSRPSLLLLLEELDHASRPPDGLAEVLAIVDTRDPEHLEPSLLELAARGLEEPLEVREVAVALREDQHLAAGLLDRLRHQIVGALVVGRGVHHVDPEGEAALQRVESLLLGDTAELTRPEPHGADPEVAPAQTAVLHHGREARRGVPRVGKRGRHRGKP